MRTFSVTVDLVGYSSVQYLDGWKMSQRGLKSLNQTALQKGMRAVTEVSGSIATDDSNSPGDYKVYLAVDLLVEGNTAAEAQRLAMSQKLVSAVIAALPASGRYALEGDVDCIDCEEVSEQELLAMTKKVLPSVRKAGTSAVRR